MNVLGLIVDHQHDYYCRACCSKVRRRAKLLQERINAPRSGPRTRTDFE
jgi:hypothetical protein